VLEQKSMGTKREWNYVGGKQANRTDQTDTKERQEDISSERKTHRPWSLPHDSPA
jgi:hypothetical protein